MVPILRQARLSRMAEKPHAPDETPALHIMQSMNVNAPLPNARHGADSLGCTSEKLHASKELSAGGVVFHRKQADTDAIGRVETPASGRGLLVGVSLARGHRRRIFQGARSALHTFDEGGMYVRDFADDYRADLYGSFDFLLIEVPQLFITRLGDDRDGPEMREIRCGAGLHDPILAHLARAIVPLVEHPGLASPLLMEQLAVVIGTRLCEQHGHVAPAPTGNRARLSRVQEAMAKEMLLSRADNPTTIADIARACGISRSHFIEAFSETLGDTPHRWLMSQRVEQARNLLRGSDLSLAEIAAGCGFSDQSHFSRVFTRAEGVTPGRWRRQSGR